MNSILSHIRLPVRFLCIWFALSLTLLSASDVAWCAAASKSAETTKPATNNNLHADPWVFGKSADRNAPIWRDGVRARNVGDKATPSRQKAVDTGSGIAGALDAAEKKRQSSLSLSWKNERSDWREPLPSDNAKPDENLPMESRHVVRALADVQADENLSINVGPELILKDERHQQGSAGNQPDSSLGMGMNFKLDF